MNTQPNSIIVWTLCHDRLMVSRDQNSYLPTLSVIHLNLLLLLLLLLF